MFGPTSNVVGLTSLDQPLSLSRRLIWADVWSRQLFAFCLCLWLCRAGPWHALTRRVVLALFPHRPWPLSKRPYFCLIAQMPIACRSTAVSRIGVCRAVRLQDADYVIRHDRSASRRLRFPSTAGPAVSIRSGQSTPSRCLPTRVLMAETTRRAPFQFLAFK